MSQPSPGDILARTRTALGLLFVLALPIQPTTAQSWSQVLTVSRAASTMGCDSLEANDQRFVIGTVEFNDSGTLRGTRSLHSISDCIRLSRRINPNGAVVVVFVHGWNHNAQWDARADSGDTHLGYFRRVLTGLALREAERYTEAGAAGRTVVGVYFGWNGLAPGGLASFAGRYDVAERIGRAASSREALHAIVRAAKDTVGQRSHVDSPLLVAGHSMGAFIVQSMITASLERPTTDALWRRPADTERCVRVLSGDRAVSFPDLVLLFEPATTSRMAEALQQRLIASQIRRVLSCNGRHFEAPVVISVTSASDWTTKWPLRIATGTRAEGHDDRLVTHHVRSLGTFRCLPRINDHIAVDFEQAWHCVREPEVVDGRLHSATVDLPGPGPRNDCHVRFHLAPTARAPMHPYWVVRIPESIVASHNDIFNARSNALVLSFAQLAGSILSINTDWDKTFERDMGPC
jgi:hypothetical protein